MKLRLLKIMQQNNIINEEPINNEPINEEPIKLIELIKPVKKGVGRPRISQSQKKRNLAAYAKKYQKERYHSDEEYRQLRIAHAMKNHKNI